MIRTILTAFLCISWVAAPAEDAPVPQATPDVVLHLVAGIQKSRAAKDSLLRFDPGSPIIEDQRTDFQGLRYFPIDLKYYVPGELHGYGRRRQIRVPATDGSFIMMERFGRFLFQMQGKDFWLEVNRNLEDLTLTVMFTDQTNGIESYSGGRYVQLDDLGDGVYVLDFNQSYSPYCAYNPAYICPVPPPQNRLPIAIRAGEMAFGADLAQ